MPGGRLARSQAQSMSVPMCVSTVRRGRTRRDPAQHCRQIGMGPVRALAQEAADHPGVDAVQRRERRVVQSDHVGRIAEPADAQAERRDEAVVLLEQPHLAGRPRVDGVAGAHLARHQHRPEEAGRLPGPERVAEAPGHLSSVVAVAKASSGRSTMRLRMRTSSMPVMWSACAWV